MSATPPMTPERPNFIKMPEVLRIYETLNKLACALMHLALFLNHVVLGRRPLLLPYGAGDIPAEREGPSVAAKPDILDAVRREPVRRSLGRSLQKPSINTPRWRGILDRTGHPIG